MMLKSQLRDTIETLMQLHQIRPQKADRDISFTQCLTKWYITSFPISQNAKD